MSFNGSFDRMLRFSNHEKMMADYAQGAGGVGEDIRRSSKLKIDGEVQALLLRECEAAISQHAREARHGDPAH